MNYMKFFFTLFLTTSLYVSASSILSYSLELNELSSVTLKEQNKSFTFIAATDIVEKSLDLFFVDLIIKINPSKLISTRTH